MIADTAGHQDAMPYNASPYQHQYDLLVALR
jgi:hypothetical protein